MATAAERLAGSLGDRYRIERELGRGGMATVFLAEDIRHHRRVAIKVLHPELSAVLGPDRFLKEIELTANLQHPHILPLFDSGSADGLLYYVMPFVEGETLRTRLTRERQLPVPDVVRIATDVADALDYAHRHHVVHRDIKPENILLLDGRPLVADFGIALAVEQAGGMRMTQTGISLGTPQYMAPEQAMGDKHVDHRADIYSLGAVVYEMLAGDPPFTGPTAQSIVARVVTEKPRSLTSIRDTVPKYLDDAVFSALQKLPADRPATAREFGLSLAAPHPSSAFEFVPAERMSTSSLVGGIALTAALFGIAGYALGYRTHDFSVGESEPSRLAILAPDLGGSGGAGTHRQIAITPDGKAVLYVALNREGDNTLMYRRLDSENAVAIQSKLGLLDPVISPDGRTVMAAAGIGTTGVTPRNVSFSLAGGQETELPDAINLAHAEIQKDGSVWYTAQTSGTFSVVRPGEKPRVFFDSTGFRFMQMLSDDRALATRGVLGTNSGPIVLIDVKTGATTEVVSEQVSDVRYAAGYLAYVRNDATLWAAPFDKGKGTLKAPPVQIATGVSTTGTGIAQFAFSRSGNLAYIPEEPRWLVLVDRDGKLRYATAERRLFHAPRFSPDGTRISMDFTTSSGRDVWMLSLNRGTMSRATFERDGHDATWTRDGQHITYTTIKNGVLGVYRTRPGGGPVDSLLSLKTLGYTGEWLPDGKSLVTTIRDFKSQSGADISVIENMGRGPIRPLITDQFETNYPVVSPNGKWLAYVSNKSGAQEVYARPFSGDGDDIQISLSGGSEPVWSPDSRLLYYRGNSNRGVDLVEAVIRESPSLDVLSRRTLFAGSDMVPATPHANYDISPDGKTFVMVRRSPSTRIVVIQNLPGIVKAMRESAR
jgi:serine/threonine-protein kinase